MENKKTPIGRFSWVFVFGEGDTQEDGSNKFKVNLMFPKNAKALESLGLNPKKAKAMLKSVVNYKAAVLAECEDLAKAAFKKNWKTTRWDPFLDGDEKSSSWAGYENFWILRLKTQYKPKIQNPDPADGFIVDGDEDPKTGFYAGCWGRCVIDIYTYDFKGKKGLGVGLGAIQKAYNDDVLSGKGEKFEDKIEELDIDEDDLMDDEEEESDPLDDLK